MSYIFRSILFYYLILYVGHVLQWPRVDYPVDYLLYTGIVSSYVKNRMKRFYITIFCLFLFLVTRGSDIHSHKHTHTWQYCFYRIRKVFEESCFIISSNTYVRTYVWLCSTCLCWIYSQRLFPVVYYSYVCRIIF